MTVKRNKKGVLYWTTCIDGKRIKRESKFWKTQREAKEHHKQFIDSLKHNQHQLHNISYEELLKLYIDHISLSRKWYEFGTMKYKWWSLSGLLIMNYTICTIGLKPFI